jgi:hypothetical protein
MVFPQNFPLARGYSELLNEEKSDLTADGHGFTRMKFRVVNFHWADDRLGFAQ